MPVASLAHSRHGPAVMHSPSTLSTQTLDTLRVFLEHSQHSGFPRLQLPQVDVAGVVSLVRHFHCLKHDRAIIVGDVADQVYTVLEAALVLEVATRHV